MPRAARQTVLQAPHPRRARRKNASHRRSSVGAPACSRAVCGTGGRVFNVTTHRAARVCAYLMPVTRPAVFMRPLSQHSRMHANLTFGASTVGAFKPCWLQTCVCGIREHVETMIWVLCGCARTCVCVLCVCVCVCVLCVCVLCVWGVLRMVVRCARN